MQEDLLRRGFKPLLRKEPLNKSSVGVLNPCSLWSQQELGGSLPPASCPLTPASKDKSLLFPQFKENPVVQTPRRGVCTHIKLPKIGAIPINLHRPIPNGFWSVQVRILRKADIATAKAFRTFLIPETFGSTPFLPDA
jgi:hypothetical protein